MAAFDTLNIKTPTRPCWVDGRRAIFHRWTDSARPAKARGVEDDDNAQRFQLHSVHALVEYEDGTLQRVWPGAVQFADSEKLFTEYDWDAMEGKRDALPYTFGAEPAADQDKAERHDTAAETEHPDPACAAQQILERCESCKHKARLFDNTCLYCLCGDRYEPKGGRV